MTDNDGRNIEGLPIYGHLDAICDELKKSRSRFLVLTAETGAGKSTALPLALLKNFPGKILMLEPRRIAVLNIAYRVSELLGENPGESCGYVMHMDSCVSEKTRFTLMTEAVLTRKIQQDPSLAGVSVVVVDEFHERSLNADLDLAFLKESMALRDDLYVVVMSATINAKKISSYLGADENNPCPVYSVPGRLFPVRVEYQDGTSVSKAVIRELEQKEADAGSILVFLPGIREIREVQESLSGVDAEICILHSSVPMDEQKKVLRKNESDRRRVILSSAIAETSLTVPDVNVVIDSGWARQNVFNQALGMEKLVTQRITAFSAGQRMGRAGRVREGKCVRLWNEHERLAQEVEPEILRSDLAPLVLECAVWGNAEWGSLRFLDNPSEGAWKSAVALLEMLGCMRDGDVTELGKICLGTGLHPRLACVALSGAAENQLEFSTGIALDFMSQGLQSPQIKDRYRKKLLSRVQGLLKTHRLDTVFPQKFAKFSTACALLCGYPDRLGIQQADDAAKYQFPSGRMARIVEKLPDYPKYIVAPDVDAGETQGKIFSYESLEADAAEDFIRAHSRTFTLSEFEENGTGLRKTEYTAFGKIILAQRRLPLDDGDYGQAVCNKIRSEGLSFLPLGEASKEFLMRVEFFLENVSGENDVGRRLREKYKSLETSAEEWLLPFLPGKQKVSEDVVFHALEYYLESEEINRNVPRDFVLPSGRKRKLLYEKHGGKIIPTLEIIIQQIFGCLETPKIMGVPLLFKMLSPARRPLQITSDLENFWKNTWPELCSEMKGRYPKHNWDYRVVSEEN